MTTHVERSIDIEMPVRTVYDQWTQFEEWPLFMEDVDRVEQLADDELRWHVSSSTTDREWVARITEQIPDKRIAWTSLEGPKHAGVVTFHRLRDDLTRVMVQLDFIPEGFIEGVADAFGVVSRWVEDELETFKSFMEERGKSTGGWRGEIDHHADEPESGATVTTENDTDGGSRSRSSDGDPSNGERSLTDDSTAHRSVDHRTPERSGSERR